MRSPFRAIRAIAPLLVLATAGCGDTGPEVEPQQRVAASAADTRAPAIAAVDTLLRDLVVPWGVVELPDGGLFVAERPGRIRYLAPGADSAVLWATLDVYAEDPGIGPEAGLMGLALDPEAEGGIALYALATTWRSRGDRDRALPTRVWRRLAGAFSPAATLRYKNQVLRLSRSSDGSVQREVIVDELPTAYYHAGGSISVGPDGHLYVGVGDAILPQLARRPRTPVGKILRFTRDGAIPGDNPDPSSPVFARGLRNTQALAWLPDGTLLGADHGPSGMEQEGGRQGLDELNLIRVGGDYGWPDVLGSEAAEGIAAPVWLWDEAIAPAGMATRPGAAADTVQVLVGGLRGRLEQLTLVRAGAEWRVSGRAQFPHGAFGRVRSVVVSRDGTVLLTTSNRDVRGVPRPGDDLLLRLTLAP